VNVSVRVALIAAILLGLTGLIIAQPAAPVAPLKVQQSNDDLVLPATRLPAQSQIPPSNGGVQLAIYLCLLVGLFIGGSYLLKNGFTVFQPKAKGSRKLAVMETRMLGNRQFLVVAEYEGRKMLLGVCPGRIDLLSELGNRADDSFATHLEGKE